MRKILKKLLGYFISGLAIVLPLILTFWLIFYLITTLDSYLKLKSSVLILLGIMLVIVLIGFIARTYVQHTMWKEFEAHLIKLPILGLIYKSVKDLTSALIGRDRKFSEPVMVRFHDGEIYKIGFITNKEVQILLGDITDNEKEEVHFLVYFPLSFSLSGDLFLVPQNRIRLINAKAKDVMQTIVSGGIINVE